MMPMTGMPRAKAAKPLCRDEKPTANILPRRVVKAVDARPPADLGKPGVDETSFRRFHLRMGRRRPKPTKEAARTLLRPRSKTLAHFGERLTNATCEGINAMVQAAKRKARGCHTFEGCSAMICLTAGKLDLATPNPFRHFH